MKAKCFKPITAIAVGCLLTAGCEPTQTETKPDTAPEPATTETQPAENDSTMKLTTSAATKNADDTSKAEPASAPLSSPSNELQLTPPASNQVAKFSPGLSVGEVAPAFSLTDQDGTKRSLNDLSGESKYVALVFYRSADW